MSTISIASSIRLTHPGFIRRADLSASTSVQTSPLPATPAAASPPPSTVSSPIIEVPVVPPPKPKELYDKGIQTADFSTSTRDDLPSSADPNSHAGGVGKEDTEELRARIMAELEEERKQLDAEIAEEKRKAELQLEEERARGLSQPALASVLASPPFLDFLNSSSKIVQRALSDSYDYLRDYTVSATDENADTDGAKVRLLGSWYDDKWGRGRSVTDVDWSPKVGCSSMLAVADSADSRFPRPVPRALRRILQQEPDGRQRAGWYRLRLEPAP